VLSARSASFSNKSNSRTKAFDFLNELVNNYIFRLPADFISTN